MIASASAGEKIYPSFPKVLSELTLSEIRILDFIYEKDNVRQNNMEPDIPPKYEYISNVDCVAKTPIDSDIYIPLDIMAHPT